MISNSSWKDKHYKEMLVDLRSKPGQKILGEFLVLVVTISPNPIRPLDWLMVPYPDAVITVGLNPFLIVKS